MSISIVKNNLDLIHVGDTITVTFLSELKEEYFTQANKKYPAKILMGGDGKPITYTYNSNLGGAVTFLFTHNDQRDGITVLEAYIPTDVLKARIEAMLKAEVAEIEAEYKAELEAALSRRDRMIADYCNGAPDA